jgi:hypothetical protein
MADNIPATRHLAEAADLIRRGYCIGANARDGDGRVCGSMAAVLSNCTEGGPSSKFPAGNPGLAIIVCAAIPRTAGCPES